MSERQAGGARDEAWFDAFFRAHHGAVRAYASRRVGAVDADDVVVEVFATAWSCRAQVPAEPLPWLYRCAWHRIATRQRAEARRSRLLSRVAAQPRAASDGAPELDWVHDVLTSLDPQDAEVLRLAA